MPHSQAAAPPWSERSHTLSIRDPYGIHTPEMTDLPTYPDLRGASVFITGGGSF